MAFLSSSAVSIVIGVVCFFALFVAGYRMGYSLAHFFHKRRIRRQLAALASNALEITPMEFFDIRNTRIRSKGNALYSKQFDYPGVYVLYNYTRDLPYVGQGARLLERVNKHFTGYGNGDVYADFKYGDSFTIKTISLFESGYVSLNELERHMIHLYDAYNRGYNKTRGNRTQATL